MQTTLEPREGVAGERSGLARFFQQGRAIAGFLLPYANAPIQGKGHVIAPTAKVAFVTIVLRNVGWAANPGSISVAHCRTIPILAASYLRSLSALG